MKVEIRNQGLILIVETKEESQLIDSALGSHVGEDGLISKGEYEVRLSDGYGDHYICLKSPKELNNVNP